VRRLVFAIPEARPKRQDPSHDRVHVVKVSSKGQIVIPKDVRKRHRLERDTDLVLLEFGDALVLRKKADAEEILEGGFGPLQRASVEALKELWDNPEDDVWDRV